MAYSQWSGMGLAPAGPYVLASSSNGDPGRTGKLSASGLNPKTWSGLRMQSKTAKSQWFLTARWSGTSPIGSKSGKKGRKRMRCHMTFKLIQYTFSNPGYCRDSASQSSPNGLPWYEPWDFPKGSHAEYARDRRVFPSQIGHQGIIVVSVQQG